MGLCTCASRAPMQIIAGILYLVKPDPIFKRQESSSQGCELCARRRRGLAPLENLRDPRTKSRAPGETPWMGKSPSNQLMTTDGGLKAVVLLFCLDAGVRRELGPLFGVSVIHVGVKASTTGDVREAKRQK